ncbi:hypothetical protein H6P81_016782 [Aristolochia fimbriata]|uniref:Methyltransferase type 11 domain-containing protein n=1 Tax=Aristolochia fimbriata TaxID=158543 RepID=A0AAV7ECI4_ARIFI|nr:hypothetical protein H6P81_016782 [Aristolochia fimbriata]
MEPGPPKPVSLRNFLVRVLLFGVCVVVCRFAYVVTIRGEACDAGDFCFFPAPESLSILGGAIDSTKVFVRDVDGSAVVPDPALRDLWTSREWRKTVEYYSSVFQDLIAMGFLSPASKALCVETATGQDVLALREVGVSDAVGIYKKASKPLVVKGNSSRHPFDDDTFDFIFAGGGVVDSALKIEEFAAEIGRTLKPEGFAVLHTASTKDVYSLHSFLNMFNCCSLVRSFEIDGPDSSSPSIREMVLRKEKGYHILGRPEEIGSGGDSLNKCAVSAHKRQLLQDAEPLIREEPLKPWITLKRNLKNIKYLPSIADISFRRRYVYVDVGARSYGSSIGSWFRKQYPKQNRTFDIYAIEADKTFHEEYSKKKGVNLMPYAAWLRNETLYFEINRDPGQSHEENLGGRGMGRIKPAGAGSINSAAEVDKIQGFDFANWLKSTVTEKDFVVMKMDVEGTEFDLIPRLIETGALCLIDELFLECHYNRWQKCCPGERSPKYDKTYDQCLELFSSLRGSGVLVHQWW